MVAFSETGCDCEENKIKFSSQQEHSVKLNKRYYKDWDIHNYLDAKFDDWFADKIHLFEEGTLVLKERSLKTINTLSLRRHRERKTSLDK